MTEEDKPKQKTILTSLGLQEVMTETNDVTPFNGDTFHIYTPGEYLRSERKEQDEIYRMSERVLMHKASGLRLTYLTTESYYGDEYRYRFRDIFIINNRNQRIPVTGVDFSTRQFVTPDGVIPFGEVKMDSQGD